jgi:hypothetical protein
MATYDWPELDGLVAFVQKHGITEAARRLGVHKNTLRGHLNDNGIKAADYTPAQQMNADALKEIADLLDG